LILNRDFEKLKYDLYSAIVRFSILGSRFWFLFKLVILSEAGPLPIPGITQVDFWSICGERLAQLEILFFSEKACEMQ
jgi:hypothetical protein